MTSEYVLKQNGVTNEKNVYGFVYILLLYSELTKTPAIELIRLMGAKYKNFILCGWGDLNQNRNKTIIQWDSVLLKINRKFDINELLCNRISNKSHKICDKIFEIKENNKDIRYSDIIKQIFSK